MYACPDVLRRNGLWKPLFAHGGLPGVSVGALGLEPWVRRDGVEPDFAIAMAVLAECEEEQEY